MTNDTTYPVTQADIDAVARLVVAGIIDIGTEHDRARALQAFARHRIKALEQAAAVARAYGDEQDKAVRSSVIRNAILALRTSEKSDGLR